MKLELNKQVLVKLTNTELSSVNGGGVKRSNHRLSNCRYSRVHPEKKKQTDPTTGDTVTWNGCAASYQESDDTVVTAPIVIGG